MVAAAYGDEYYVGDLISDAFDGTATDTSSTAITVPTTNNRQIAVLIQMDASTGTLEYKQSTAAFPASISREVAYTSTARCPRKDSGRYRIGYVFLKAGMTTITYNDIWEMPEIFSDAKAYGFPHTITTTVTIPSGNQQLFKGELVIDGGELVVNGELVFV